MTAGVAGPGCQQKAEVLPFCAQRQQQHIPFRLLDLVDPPTQDPLPQFLNQRVDTYSVKGHRYPSVMAANSVSIRSNRPRR